MSISKKSGSYDVIVVGAGAAGMMCAAVAGQAGKSVLLVDHASKLAEKIRISGGGRCNFTNLHATWQNFISDNPHFCRSALSRYSPQDFLNLVKRYRIAFHEKHKGQLFCDVSAEDIINMLRSECNAGQVSWAMPCKVLDIDRSPDGFVVTTEEKILMANNVVIATGGLSIPKIGATDFSYRIAKKFGLKVVEPRPALVPLTFEANDWAAFVSMAGISLEVDIETGSQKNKIVFREDLLFTHRGLSGPAILQISSYWQPKQSIFLNLLPEVALSTELIQAKTSSKKNLTNWLSAYLPLRLVEGLLAAHGFDGNLRIADMPDKRLQLLGEKINRWELIPNGTEGYRKAEVTRGGVDTRELSQQSMMSKKVPGLFFVGEAVDVTGWLGGFNFQWAWASGVAAGQGIAEQI
ncbi:NAD(P)/FAD-dependent oxidoreductase [Undibacterium fentianense]|uniref:NAD(P)/FAD-dependent oxidoreductase n=1 Tax=Undibacterium fentianense TaxID=2828728 RepID=A0A941DZC4_9BURK|nr:NAD(P)/FAD-dependent oxidoreductase [Undibacterium fentianense]MBR7799585.1 NAD(P)/FAD-dependent oxidoreductase [Undibacterium fentianense]